MCLLELELYKLVVIKEDPRISKQKGKTNQEFDHKEITFFSEDKSKTIQQKK